MQSKTINWRIDYHTGTVEIVLNSADVLLQRKIRDKQGLNYVHKTVNIVTFEGLTIIFHLKTMSLFLHLWLLGLSFAIIICLIVILFLDIWFWLKHSQLYQLLYMKVNSQNKSLLKLYKQVQSNKWRMLWHIKNLWLQ